MKKFKQNGRQSAILDWIAKQNDVHMYAMVLCHCAKFEQIPFRHVREMAAGGRTDGWMHGTQSISPCSRLRPRGLIIWIYPQSQFLALIGNSY